MHTKTNLLMVIFWLFPPIMYIYVHACDQRWLATCTQWRTSCRGSCEGGAGSWCVEENAARPWRVEWLYGWGERSSYWKTMQQNTTQQKWQQEIQVSSMCKANKYVHVYIQASYAYSLLMSAIKFETLLSRDRWLFWSHHGNIFSCTVHLQSYVYTCMT